MLSDSELYRSILTNTKLCLITLAIIEMYRYVLHLTLCCVIYKTPRLYRINISTNS